MFLLTVCFGDNSIRASIFTAYLTTSTCVVIQTWTMLTSVSRGFKRTIRTILQYSLVVFRSLIRDKTQRQFGTSPK